MSDLKAALNALGPVSFDDLPSDSELSSWLSTALSHAESVINSLPWPAATANNVPPAAKADSATCASDTLLDVCDLPDSSLPRDAENEHKKAWGKPMKMSAKENPLKVNMYKMAAHDRHGAWFARRSIHQGLPFEHWKRCLQREFLESLKVKKGPGSGAVRGIAGDRRLEKKKVDTKGNIEIWQLSSAFPGPVTPREFVEMIVTSDSPLSTTQAAASKPPRSYVIISRPSSHPEAAERPGLVMGSYQSVEIAREIPLYPENPDANPVEWTMITRSDPGGGIPRFLVERGTPGSVVADVAKWLDWACTKGRELPDQNDEQEDAEVDAQNQHTSTAESAERQGVGHKAAVAGAQTETTAGNLTSSKGQQDGTNDNDHFDDGETNERSTYGGPIGYLGMIRNAVGDTMSGYLPYFSSGVHQESEASSDEESSSDSVSSQRSFTSAVTNSHSKEQVPQIQYDKGAKAAFSDPALVRSNSSVSGLEASLTHGEKPQNSTEKDLLKLSQKRADLDAKIDAARVGEQKRVESHTDQDEKERQKTEERHEKELKKQEERYKKEVEKLEARKEKTLKKAEERRNKQLHKDELRRTKADRDEWRERCRVIEKENEILRRQVEDMQKENTSIVATLGGHGEEGQEILRKARQDNLGVNGKRSRATSRSSAKSKESGHSRNVSQTTGDAVSIDAKHT